MSPYTPTVVGQHAGIQTRSTMHTMCTQRRQDSPIHPSSSHQSGDDSTRYPAPFLITCSLVSLRGPIYKAVASTYSPACPSAGKLCRRSQRFSTCGDKPLQAICLPSTRMYRCAHVAHVVYA